MIVEDRWRSLASRGSEQIPEEGGAVLAWPSRSIPALLRSQQFDFEDESRVRRYRTAGRAHGPVAEVGRNDEFPLSADLHAHNALIPASDDSPAANGKGQRLSTNGAVKFCSVYKGTGVMYGHNLSQSRAGSGTHHDVHVLESRRRDCFRRSDRRELR